MTIAAILLGSYASVAAAPHTWPSIADHDFNNFTYACSTGTVTLKNGQFRDPGKECGEFSWLTYLNYVDIDKDDEPEAIVSVRKLPCGSQLTSDDIFVFKQKKGQLIQVGHVWREDLKSILVANGQLIVEASLWAETDPHCCPSHKERTQFNLREDKLEKINSIMFRVE